MEQVKQVSFFAHESALYREERVQKRLWIALLAMIGVNGGLICLEFFLRKKNAN